MSHRIPTPAPDTPFLKQTILLPDPAEMDRVILLELLGLPNMPDCAWIMV
jgi:hypothetical protein